MSDILEQIAEHNRTIYLDKKLELSLSKVMDMAYAAPSTDFAFEKKLKEDFYKMEKSAAEMEESRKRFDNMNNGK